MHRRVCGHSPTYLMLSSGIVILHDNAAGIEENSVPRITASLPWFRRNSGEVRTTARSTSFPHMVRGEKVDHEKGAFPLCHTKDIDTPAHQTSAPRTPHKIFQMSLGSRTVGLLLVSPFPFLRVQAPKHQPLYMMPHHVHKNHNAN